MTVQNCNLKHTLAIGYDVPASGAFLFAQEELLNAKVGELGRHAKNSPTCARQEIGRASCRERV